MKINNCDNIDYCRYRYRYIDIYIDIDRYAPSNYHVYSCVILDILGPFKESFGRNCHCPGTSVTPRGPFEALRDCVLLPKASPEALAADPSLEQQGERERCEDMRRDVKRVRGERQREAVEERERNRRVNGEAQQYLAGSGATVHFDLVQGSTKIPAVPSPSPCGAVARCFVPASGSLPTPGRQTGSQQGSKKFSDKIQISSSNIQNYTNIYKLQILTNIIKYLREWIDHFLAFPEPEYIDR